MDTPAKVSAQEWEAAWQRLLVEGEGAYTRAGDALAALRRQMPWTAVEKQYAFVGPDGEAGLLDLFEDVVSCSSTGPSSSPACTAGRSTPALGARCWPIRWHTSPT